MSSTKTSDSRARLTDSYMVLSKIKFYCSCSCMCDSNYCAHLKYSPPTSPIAYNSADYKIWLREWQHGGAIATHFNISACLMKQLTTSGIEQLLCNYLHLQPQQTPTSKSAWIWHPEIKIEQLIISSDLACLEILVWFWRTYSNCYFNLHVNSKKEVIMYYMTVLLTPPSKAHCHWFRYHSD